MGEKLTQSGGLGGNTEGEMAAGKRMANRGDGKHAHTDTRYLLNIRGIAKFFVLYRNAHWGN
jgi:hypothetical protein